MDTEPDAYKYLKIYSYRYEIGAEKGTIRISAGSEQAATALAKLRIRRMANGRGYFLYPLLSTLPKQV